MNLRQMEKELIELRKIVDSLNLSSVGQVEELVFKVNELTERVNARKHNQKRIKRDKCPKKGGKFWGKDDVKPPEPIKEDDSDAPEEDQS